MKPKIQIKLKTILGTNGVLTLFIDKDLIYKHIGTQWSHLADGWGPAKKGSNVGYCTTDKT